MCYVESKDLPFFYRKAKPSLPDLRLLELAVGIQIKVFEIVEDREEYQCSHLCVVSRLFLHNHLYCMYYLIALIKYHNQGNLWEKKKKGLISGLQC